VSRARALLVVLVANMLYAFKTVRVDNPGMGGIQSGRYTTGMGPTTLEYVFWGVRSESSHHQEQNREGGKAQSGQYTTCWAGLLQN